ncbi:Sodium:solute symporter family [Popillia japonica]|uniref:Sodium:solute symporter family n=1 Tax=Popillia japonica TaxID=7064 RepID=A0AAW1KMM9_POPJA
MEERIEFSWHDYGVFGLMLALSTTVGVYFGFIKRQVTSNDYLLGGKNMSIIPVSSSLIASILSGVTLLAIPADVYLYGVTLWFTVPMFILTNALTSFVYMPVFYELQVTSTFEYLKLRFNNTIRTFASVLFVIGQLLYLPIVVYVPALALSQATNINTHVIVPLICTVCVFYTSFGGLRAVVWTDALQFIVMVAAIIAIVALGFSSDDIENIWNKNYEYGRLDISFSIDVTKRDTFWTATIGNSLIWTTYFMYNQGFVQKCISLPHYKAVRCAIINFAIGVMIIFSLAILTGLLMFAKYWNCDPQLLGKIKQYDQLLPYYVMDIARTIPGLPGLFISGIFSAALSTLSASINCLSASIYEDFIAPHIKKGTSERAITNYLKLLAMLIGALVTLLTYIIPYLGTIQPLAITVGSVTGSTLLGFYTCGMLIPAINAKGALFGGLTSILFVTWIISGAQYYKSVGLITYEPLPIGTGGCQNVTFLNSSVISYSRKTEEAAFVIYRISFYYYTLLGLLVFLLVAFIVSKLTPNCNKRLTKKYFSPVIRRFFNDSFISSLPRYTEQRAELLEIEKDS